MNEEVVTEKPTSGYHLAQMLDVSLDEGVVVAVLTEELDEVTTQEIAYLDKHDESMHVVLCHSKAWGTRAMDVISPSGEKVKWWRAKTMMGCRGHDIIPVRWEGPIGEIPQQYFEKDYVLAIRFYDSGPWFFPKEQPKFSVDPELVDAVEKMQ